jgi:hypothetical protein
VTLFQIALRDDGKLVRCDPARRATRQFGHTARRLAQHRIAVIVAKGVVDRAKVVHVHIQQAETPGTAIAPQTFFIQGQIEPRPIHQPGHFIR